MLLTLALLLPLAAQSPKPQALHAALGPELTTYKLDVAAATLGCGKTADGLQALRWWQQGVLFVTVHTVGPDDNAKDASAALQREQLRRRAAAGGGRPSPLDPRPSTPDHAIGRLSRPGRPCRCGARPGRGRRRAAARDRRTPSRGRRAP